MEDVNEIKEELVVDKAADDVIVIDHVYKSFANNHVLKDFNLVLHKGESIVILGKSGSGKSVLIKCIIGLLTPDKGSIKVFGKDVVEMDSDELDQLRAKVGFLFQSNALYDSMTVKENLEFPLRRHWMQLKKKKKKIEDMVMKALEDVGLPQTLHMMPAELSGGMRKRIALARTLILQPKIILYDEPTTGLDTVTGKEIIELMVDISKKYKTSALIISHDMNCVRMASDRVALLYDGQCYAEGKYETVIKSDDKNIHQFFE